MMSAGARITTVLCDDHPLVLRGLVNLLADEPEFDVLVSTTNSAEAVQAIMLNAPDLAVLDIVMPGLSGLDVLQQIAGANSPTRVIFLSALITPEQYLQAIAMGAWGILLKESAPETLIDCMRAVAGGNRCLGGLPQLEGSENAVARPADVDASVLTVREREIATLVTAGHTNKAIARMLRLSEGTVKIHLHNIFNKLAVSNRTTLAAKMFPLRDKG